MTEPTENEPAGFSQNHSTQVALNSGHPPPLQPPTDTSFFQKISNKLHTANTPFFSEKIYLQFDRTFFSPGETLWFKAYFRNAKGLKTKGISNVIFVKFIAPNGNVAQEIELIAKNGQATGDFQIPASANGGVYKIRAFTNWMKNFDDGFEREIQVQATVLPRLRMELDFGREAYGPDDEVVATLDLNSLSNEPLANHDFLASASLDGEQFTQIEGATDGFGKAQIKFSLPQNLETNDGLLNVRLKWQGQVESISRGIPIVLHKIDLQFLPEGGHLVNGLPGNLAFKALNEFGKPADVEGEIFNSDGQRVASFRSYHQGMGALPFLPQADEKYTARLTKPEGIKEEYALPEPLKRGYSIRAFPGRKIFRREVTRTGQMTETGGKNLMLEVHSTEEEELSVVIVSGGEVYFSQTLPAQKGSHKLDISTKNFPMGIAQVTLFDSREIPRAERLVFFHPHKKLNVEVVPGKPKYLPREKVELTVKVTDERGLPVPGEFSLAVADDNLLTFADDKQGHILSHLLLESELKGEVTEPNFYFDPPEKHPGKKQWLALDYLMLTQGWRRLDWEKILWEEPTALHFEKERTLTSGTVKDKKGLPVPRVKVALEGTRYEAMTDAFGRFEFDTILPYGVLVKVDHPLYHSYGARTRGFWEKVDIRLPIYTQNYEGKKLPVVRLQDRANFRGTSLQGTVTDAETGEPIIFGTVALYKNGVLQTGTETDLDGFYSITELDPGTYDVEFSYTGYTSIKITDVVVAAGKANLLEAKLGSGIALTEVTVVYEAPLIEQDNTSQGAVFNMGQTRNLPPRTPRKKKKKRKTAQPKAETFSKEQIKDLPTRNVNGLVALGAGVTRADEGEDISIRGSRANATNYFLDGVRVFGSMIPKQDIEQLQVATGGTEARYGELRTKNVEDLADEVRQENIRSAEREVALGFVENFAPANKKEKRDTHTGGRSVGRVFYTPRNFPAVDYSKKQKAEVRNDFRKTIHWEPRVKTGLDGKATVTFFASDAITTFRATVEGLGHDGSIGRGEGRFFTQMPFSLDAKLPVALLSGDRLKIPVTLTNNTDERLDGGLSVDVPEGFSLVKKWPGNIRLAAGESKTFYPEYEVAKGNGTEGKIAVHFSTQNLEDTFEKPIKVHRRGFPMDMVIGGNQQKETFLFDISEMIEGSLSANFKVYPTVMEELATGLERMLRQPGGCFEQTSSSNYPNVLALNFLRQTGNSQPELEKRTKGYLKHGYNRLLSFEIRGGGFEWFGQPAAHEGLTAFGLMQFVDMQSVFPVEQKVIDRTARWLLSRRDGQGGWLNGRAGTHGWQRQSDIVDAYIAWALTEAGYGEKISVEVEKSIRTARQTNDPYVLALTANTLLQLGDERAGELLDILAEKQKEDGRLEGLKYSVTQSMGKNLTVETTALATLAFLQNDQYKRNARIAIDYLAQAKTPYGFGSTQATVLALRALVSHATSFNKKRENGTVEIIVNGQKIGTHELDQGQNEAIEIHGLEKYFAEGENKITVVFSSPEATLPYDLTVSYASRQPKGSEACLLNLKTELGKAEVGMGETVRLNTTLTNQSTGAVPNPIAIVGIPAGLSVQPWQLKEMGEKSLFDFYEIKDGHVVFYFREMEAGETKHLHLDLKADLPGTFEAPASMAYLYYANEEVSWSKPERVVVF